MGKSLGCGVGSPPHFAAAEAAPRSVAGAFGEMERGFSPRDPVCWVARMLSPRHVGEDPGSRLFGTWRQPRGLLICAGGAFCFRSGISISGRRVLGGLVTLAGLALGVAGVILGVMEL